MYMHRHLAISISYGLLILISLCANNAWTDDTNTTSSNPLKKSSWWTEVQENLREQEYEITCHKEVGALHAANLRAFFRASGVELMPRTGDANWRWDFVLTSFGREGVPKPIGNINPTAEGRRVEYRHDGITEWYANRHEGIEQGFTIYERPGVTPTVVALAADITREP